VQQETWRQRLRPLIAETLEETSGQPQRDVRRALRQAWDDAGLGERRCWPYRVFRSEARIQLGLVPSKAGKPRPLPPGQMNLFEEEETDEPDL